MTQLLDVRLERAVAEIRARAAAEQHAALEARLGISRTRRGHVNPRRLRRLARTHTKAALAAATALVIGYDLSRYDGLEAVDSAAFVIVNVDDPGLGDKIGRAVAQAKPWGGYKWIYPGASGWNAATECAAKLRAFGEAPLGSWADYEDNGVDQGQLVDWFRGLDSVSARGGYYTNDWRVDHGALIAAVGTRWYWTAGYPGANDGTFPGWDALRTSRPAQLWQFTSTNGTRDQNAVVDSAWYESLGGSGSGGFLEMLTDEQQQEIYTFAHLCLEGAPEFGVPKLLPEIVEISSSVKAAPEFGIEPVAHLLSAMRNDQTGTAPLKSGGPSTRELLEQAASSGGAPLPVPGDTLTDEERAALKSRAQQLRDAADVLDGIATG